MKKYDIMVDIESLSLRPTCAIIQIGACVFDPLGDGVIGKPFIVSVDQSYYYGGIKYSSFHVDDETIKWWSEQSDRAIQALDIKLQPTLTNAFEKFSKWIRASQFRRGDDTVSCIWAQGSQFDIAALNHAMIELQRPKEWDFYQERDCRTVIREAYRDNLQYESVTYPKGLIMHRADHDAIRQVYNLQAALRAQNEEQQSPAELPARAKP